MRTVPFDDGGPTRVVSPLKKVVIRAPTPKPGSLRTPNAPKRER